MRGKGKASGKAKYGVPSGPKAKDALAASPEVKSASPTVAAIWQQRSLSHGQ
jgi:hypothetical protein